MSFDLMVKEAFDTLPLEKQAEVVDFIMFLHTKNDKSMKPDKVKRFPFDAFSGGLLHISDDFDETPECFEEYV